MTGQGVNGMAAAAAAAGALLVWSGLKGASVTGSLRALLTGVAPTGADVHPVTTPTAGPGLTGPGSTPSGPGSPAGSATPSGIASDALQYQGHCYRFGGAPGTDGKSCWDCSSFCNWVLGHDLGLAIPGSATYDGSSHGPATLSYLAWSGASTVGHTAAAAAAGDLLVWQSHMGIAIGGGQMISALDAQLGTRVTTIEGGAPGLELLFVRRLHAAAAAAAAAPGQIATRTGG